MESIATHHDIFEYCDISKTSVFFRRSIRYDTILSISKTIYRCFWYIESSLVRMKWPTTNCISAVSTQRNPLWGCGGGWGLRRSPRPSSRLCSPGIDLAHLHFHSVFDARVVSLSEPMAHRASSPQILTIYQRPLYHWFSSSSEKRVHMSPAGSWKVAATTTDDQPWTSLTV